MKKFHPPLLTRGVLVITIDNTQKYGSLEVNKNLTAMAMRKRDLEGVRSEKNFFVVSINEEFLNGMRRSDGFVVLNFEQRNLFIKKVEEKAINHDFLFLPEGLALENLKDSEIMRLKKDVHEFLKKIPKEIREVEPEKIDAYHVSLGYIQEDLSYQLPIAHFRDSHGKDSRYFCWGSAMFFRKIMAP